MATTPACVASASRTSAVTTEITIMEKVREIQGTSQLRVWEAAVSLRRREHYHRK
jgi:hypothetical protein